MTKHSERLLPLYMAKKDLPNPPSYLEDLKQLLKLDGLLNDEECDFNSSSKGNVKKVAEATHSPCQTQLI